MGRFYRGLTDRYLANEATGLKVRCEQQRGVPDGSRSVPVRPTTVMRNACQEADMSNVERDDSTRRPLGGAMLSVVRDD